MAQYFEQRPAVPSATTAVSVDVPGASFTMRTDRGVFSHGRLDAGTGVLLRSVSPPPASGVGLDLGCGTGALAITMAVRSPGLEVWAVDVNERARELCAANATAAGVAAAGGVTAAGGRTAGPGVVVAAPDDVPEDVRFDVIWSNPPIRIGKDALHDLLLTWLPRLAPAGTASLVVHKHLGADSLQRWLRTEGFPTTRDASAKGYRTLRIQPAD